MTPQQIEDKAKELYQDEHNTVFGNAFVDSERRHFIAGANYAIESILPLKIKNAIEDYKKELIDKILFQTLGARQIIDLLTPEK